MPYIENTLDPIAHHQYVIAGNDYTEGFSLLSEIGIFGDFHYDRIDGKNILDYKHDLEVDGVIILEKIK